MIFNLWHVMYACVFYRVRAMCSLMPVAAPVVHNDTLDLLRYAPNNVLKKSPCIQMCLIYITCTCNLDRMECLGELLYVD